MTSESALAGLKEHQRQRSESKSNAVFSAIESLRAERCGITVASVARKAGVSREFVHSHSDLHDAVVKAAAQAHEAVAIDAEKNRHQGLDRHTRADRATLLGQIAKQRERLTAQTARIADLEIQRQKWLGTQLEAFNESSPEVISELRISNERLMTDKASLARTVTDLRRQNEILQADLSAARQALREEMTRPTETDASAVIPFNRGP